MSDLRPFPQALDAERAVLGACFLGDLTVLDEAAALLDEGDFYSNSHRRIWRWMLDEQRAGHRPDILVLADWMMAGGEQRIEACGGLSYATSLPEAVPSSLEAPRYALLVQRAAKKRRLITLANTIRETVFEDREPEEVITLAQRGLEAVEGDTRAQTAMMSARDEVWGWLERARERHAQLAEGVLPGFSTGFPTLDRYVRLRRKKLYLVGARPSMGKSQFVLQLMNSLARQARAAGPEGVVLVFSLEMGKDELMDRWIAARTGIPYSDIADGHSVGVNGDRLPLTEREWRLIEEAAQELAELPLEFDDRPGRSIEHIRRECLRWNRQRDVVGVSLDYLQLSSAEGENQVERLTNIADGGKEIAMEIDAVFIMAAQLNRGPQQRSDKRPIPADLRGSGGLEQAADVLLGLYRDDFYEKQFSEHPNTAEVLVMKQRGGPKDVTARLGFRHGIFHDPGVNASGADPDSF